MDIEQILQDSNKLTRKTAIQYGFIPLGIRGSDNYIFSNYRQSMIILSSKDFTKPNLLNILGKQFIDNFYSIIDDKGKWRGYDLTKLQDDICESCVIEGNYNIEKVKGFGIFQDPLSPKDLIVNTENIWGTCKTFNNTRIRGKSIFNNERDLLLNSDNPSVKKEEVDELLELLRTWKFKRGEQDVRLLFGWILCAPFAGVTKWRTHASVTGRRGTGKSTLQELIKNLLGKFAFLFEGSSTESGLRQSVQKSSAAILLDESESDGVRLASILAMLRAASQGIEKAMGTTDQKGNIYSLKMAGLLTGIVPPALKGADASRFLKIELNVRDETIKNEKIIDTDWQESIGKKLIMFMIQNYNLLQDINKIVRIHLIEKGNDSRYSDTYGLLISSSFLVMNMIDEPDIDPFADNSVKELNKEELIAYIESFNFEEEKAQNAYSDEDELLKQIFITELSDDDVKKDNILQFVLLYHTTTQDKGLIKNLLGRHGIKTEKEDNKIIIYIDTDDAKLRSLLKTTRFNNGDLKAVLSRVDGASSISKEMSIGNMKRSRKNLIRIALDPAKYGSKDDPINP